MAFARLEFGDDLVDRLRLVTGGGEGADDLKACGGGHGGWYAHRTETDCGERDFLLDSNNM
jgi:hypothetical protein